MNTPYWRFTHTTTLVLVVVGNPSRHPERSRRISLFLSSIVGFRSFGCAQDDWEYESEAGVRVRSWNSAQKLGFGPGAGIRS